MKKPYQIWRDRRGRLSALRIGTLIILLLPVGIALEAYFTTGFGPRPINDLIHRAGFWALVFLGLSLAVTPFRRILHYGALIDVRRMIGVGAFAYIAAHLALYVADQSYDFGKVLSEIVSRVYLIIGMIAWLGLAVLAATSTDGMVRRLGGMTWRRVHQAIYVIGFLALIHYFQQTKADVSVPTLAAGLFGWLIGYRLLAAWWRVDDAHSPLALVALTLVVSLLTFLCEAIGIGIVFNVSPLRVLQTAFDFDAAIRPGWYVLAAGLAVALVDFVVGRVRQPKSERAPA